ncbi:NUDIX hydrolase [Enterococcus faecalis]
MKTPTFGKREETLTYQTRYAAYIIVSKPENNTMVLVQAPNGAYFLPGGEIEGTETKEEAIHREVLEELGISVEIGRYLGEADEYFYSNHRQTAYYNTGYFYVANTWRQLSEPLERTNTLHWVAPEEAVRLLKRGSHRWAVEKWLAAAS